MVGSRRPALRALGAGCAAAACALIAYGLRAQQPTPPQDPAEAAYSTNASNNQILRLDFATGTSTVVNTDSRQRKRLAGLAVRNDGFGTHLVVADSKSGELLFYENAAGAGQVITRLIPSPDSVALDLAGNAYVLGSQRQDKDDDERSRSELWALPRLLSGASAPGGYGAPRLIDGELPAKRLADITVVPFTAGRLRQGDLLVLSSKPAAVFRYPRVDCAPGDTACTGFGPREVFLSESAFPRNMKPGGFALAPNTELLISGHPGAILRYDAQGSQLQPDFAVGDEIGRSRMTAGMQAGRNYALVIQRGDDDDDDAGGSIQRFLIHDEGTGTLDATVIDNISNPAGVGLGSRFGTHTPIGFGVSVMPNPQIRLTFDQVHAAGVTTARIIEFSDNRAARHGSFEVDQSLREFFPEGSPLRSELPDVIIPAYVQAFQKGDPVNGVPTFVLVDPETTASISGRVQIEYDEREQLGYQPSCTDPDPARQPRTFFVPETDPPKSEPPRVEGPVFADVSRGCRAGVSSSPGLWLIAARDTRDLLAIIDDKRANLSRAIDFYPCIPADTAAALKAALQAAGAAFDAYEETGDAAQQAAAMAHLDALIALADANPGAFASCGVQANVRFELIARAESARELISRVVIIPLTVIKQVINDHGGTARASDFTIRITGNRRNNPVHFPGDEAGRMVGLRPGDYSVSELDPGVGYQVTLSAGCTGTITAATTSAICTVTNDDIARTTLTLIKQVVNDNGGTATASDFTLSASGPTPISGLGGVASNATFQPGTYTLSETGPPGYAASPWSCSGASVEAGNRITLAAGQNAICTISNDDIPPELTLVKVVVNNNGGTAAPASWTLTAVGPTPIAGAGGASSGPSFQAGTYALSESGPPGYGALPWTCSGGVQSGNLITLGLGESAVCGIVNNDIPPQLTLVKQVINDSGGTATAAAFILSASGPTPISGAGGAVSDATFQAGTYTLAETGPAGYAASAWSCTGGTQAGNQVTIGLGQNATCTITNDDIPLGPPPGSLGMVADQVGTVTVFDSRTDTVLGTVNIGGPGVIGDCSITPDGTRGFVTDLRNQVWVIDLGTTPPSLAGGTNPVPISNSGEDTSISPDGRYLVACDGSANQPVSVIEIGTQREINTFNLGHDCNSVDVCSDGSVLVTSANTNRVRRLRIDAAGSLSDTGEALSLIVEPNNVFCAPDGRSGIVITRDADQIVSFRIPGLASVDTRHLSGNFGISGLVTPAGNRVFTRDNGSFGSVNAFSYDSSSATLGSSPIYQIPIRDAPTFFGMDQMALGPGGDRLYVSQPSAVHVYEAASGAFLRFITGSGISSPTGVCFASRGTPKLTASFFGGPGDQRGTSIHRDGSDLYVSGSSGNQALLLRHGTSLGAPAWSATLPPDTFFEGVTLAGSTVFGAGGALPPTCGASDAVGGTEHKSALGRFATDGSLLGCQSTNYFSFRGGEGYSDALALGGNVYAVGGAENCGFGHSLFVLSKFDASGALLASATEPGVSFGGFNCVGGSHGQALAELNGALYIAGDSGLSGLGEDAPGDYLRFRRPVLMKYDTALNRAWKRRPSDYPAGVFLGVAALGSHIYAVGQQYMPGVPDSNDYLIEKYDEAGNRLWSRISGGARNDVLTGVVAIGARLFAVGYTYSEGSGGADVVILEIDPATGDTRSSTLFGGAQDDFARDVATDGAALYVVGESRSFANAGNAIGQNDVMILRYVPAP